MPQTETKEKRPPGRSTAAQRPAAQNRARKRAYGNKRKARIYLALSAAATLVAVVLAGTVFFRVESFEVLGNSRYSKEELTEATGIAPGSNLFLMNKFRIIDGMLGGMIYLRDVEIRRVLPGTIRITVEEAEIIGYLGHPAYADLGLAAGFFSVDDKGRLLENVSKPPAGACVITGIEADRPALGEALAPVKADREKAQPFEELMSALYESGLHTEVTGISFEKIYELKISCGGFEINLGKSGSLLEVCTDVKLLLAELEKSGRTSGRIEVIDGRLHVSRGTGENGETGQN